MPILIFKNAIKNKTFNKECYLRLFRHRLFSKFRYERNFNLFHVINEENIIERGLIAYGEIHHLVKVLVRMEIHVNHA